MNRRGHGLQPVLHTNDFSEWEAATTAHLGHHRSLLHGRSTDFRACFRSGQAGPLQLLHLQGRGVLELEREQVGAAVLWIPLRGTAQERLNGQLLEINPGEALLIRPGDQLRGRTPAELEGLSLLLPAAEFSGTPASLRLLGAQPGQQRLLAQARLLWQATKRRDPGRAHAARQLLDQLADLLAAPTNAAPHPSMSQRRRWQLVQDAEQWMAARLDQAFGIGDLAAALEVPKRTLQHAFTQELGRSPLARARQLRLRALRHALQDPGQSSPSIAELMGRCGLLACGATARAYAACYGELPRNTRAHNQHRTNKK